MTGLYFLRIIAQEQQVGQVGRGLMGQGDSRDEVDWVQEGAGLAAPAHIKFYSPLPGLEA